MKYSRQTRRRKRDQMEETLNTQDQTPETTDGFLEGLDDMEPTADQPEIPSETTQDSAPHEKTKAESGEEPQPAQEPPTEAEEGPAEEPPKTWTLQHLGENRTVNEAEMTALFTPVHVPADSVTFRSKNVVVLVLESFGKEYFGSLNKELEDGNYKGYTPFLDSLVSESLVYKYSFANGQQSIDGLPSILSGIPRFVEPFFLTPASLNKLSSVGGELKKKGYYTAFFHGARDGSMGFQAYARAVGYPDYFGREEYGNDDDFDGNWAIWDEEFLQFFADKMSSFPQPFSAGIFTASSHHPYVIPDRYKGVFPDGTLEIHKCIRYSDNALRLFFEKASKESWFENTLFVLTADHTNQTEHPEYWTDYGRYAVPIIFYTPDGDLKGYRDAIAQQIDIMPTVLSYLGYDKPYVSFGCDLLNTPAEDTYAVNYNNGIYQYFKGDYILQFDGEKTVAVYAFKTDKLLKENLVGQVPQQGAMELELKAIIQQYMERMNGDRMTVE